MVHLLTRMWGSASDCDCVIAGLAGLHRVADLQQCNQRPATQAKICGQRPTTLCDQGFVRVTS